MKYKFFIFICIIIIITVIYNISQDARDNSEKRFKAIEGLLARVQLLSPKATVEKEKLKTQLDDALGRISSLDNTSEYWILKARYELSDDSPVKHANGKVVSPSDTKGLEYLGEAKKHLGKIEKVADREEMQARIFQLEAKFFLRLDRSEDALKSLEEAWALNKKSRRTARLLSEAYLELAVGPKAEDKLNKALEFANLAIRLSETVVKDRSLDSGEKIITLYPEAFNQRALVYLRFKEYLNAYADLHEAIRQNRSYSFAYYNLAICCGFLSKTYERGKNSELTYQQEAIRCYEELRSLDPSLARKLYYEDGFSKFIDGF